MSNQQHKNLENTNIEQIMMLKNSSLLKYSLLSLVFATVILLTIVLPAEYNIDPLGIGEKLGLTVFSDPDNTAKLNKLNKLKGSESQENFQRNTYSPQVINVKVPAGRGVEYKFHMQQYQKLTYQWQTDNTALYFDLHGEPEGDTTGYFESYAIATLKSMEGSFTAPFTGVHGWYWKNTSDQPVNVQLTVKGDFGHHSLK